MCLLPLPTPTCPDTTCTSKRQKLNLKQRSFLAAFACLQNALVGGVIYGWASIDRTLLVASEDLGGAELTPMQTTQIFSMASSVAMCSSVVIGLVLDKYGPRSCSILAHVLIGSGCHLFSVAKSFETFAFAACCMAFGGPGIYYSLVHIAKLFIKNQFLVMSIIGGSVTLSFSVLSIFGDIWETYQVGFRTLFKGYLFIVAISALGALCLLPDAPFEATDSNESDYNSLPVDDGDDGVEDIPSDRRGLNTDADMDTHDGQVLPVAVTDGYMEATIAHHQLIEEPLESGLRRKLSYGRTESYLQSAQAIQTGRPQFVSLKDQPFWIQFCSSTYLRNFIFLIITSFFANFTIASLSTELADEHKFSITVQHSLSHSFTSIMSCGLVGSLTVGSLMDRIGLEWCTMLTILLGQASLVTLTLGHRYSIMMLGFFFYTLFRQFLFPVFIARVIARLGFKYFGILSGIGFTLSGFAQIWMANLVEWLQGDCHLQQMGIDDGSSVACDHGGWITFHCIQILILGSLLFIPITEKLAMIRLERRGGHQTVNGSSPFALKATTTASDAENPVFRKAASSTSSTYGSIKKSAPNAENKQLAHLDKSPTKKWTFFWSVALCSGPLLVGANSGSSSSSSSSSFSNHGIPDVQQFHRSNRPVTSRICVDEAASLEEEGDILLDGDQVQGLEEGEHYTSRKDVSETNRRDLYRLKGLLSPVGDNPELYAPQTDLPNPDNVQKHLKFKPTLLSTGTTIAGVCGFGPQGKPFVVLGADTRATAGRMVADKRCQKIHCLAQNLWCCGAGTAADLDHVTRNCRYSLAMQSLIERESIGNDAKHWNPLDDNAYSSHLERTAEHVASMALACRFLRDVLFEGGGSVGANLIVGGVDEETGMPQIRAIHPGGSMDTLSYAALGSGGLAAMAVIESRFHNNISLEEGIRIVQDAILSGIQNDMGSGSQVDLCIITTMDEASSSGGGGIKVVANYTRAAVPEEEIISSAEGSGSSWVDEYASQEREYKGEIITSTPGVNGFGNFPFTVRSRRRVLFSRQHSEQERFKKWEDLLGLGSSSK